MKKTHNDRAKHLERLNVQSRKLSVELIKLEIKLKSLYGKSLIRFMNISRIYCQKMIEKKRLDKLILKIETI